MSETSHVNMFLRCTVREGMFSDERIVIVSERGNGPVEFIVPESFVEGDGDNGSVQVRVYQAYGGQWAELPTPNRDAIPIDDEQLVS